MLKKNKLPSRKGLLTLLGVFCLFIAVIFPQKIFALLVDESATAAANVLAYIQPIMTYFWGLITQLLSGLVYLIMGSSLLQTTINNSSVWLDINSNFIKIGTNITTAMADILLIAVFIAIAIGYVFKIEGYNNKKSVIKFFVTALLIHFAPLFVGMITDISNIITRGIMMGKESIFVDVFIKDMGIDIITSIGALSSTFSLAAIASITGTVGTVSNLGVITLSVANLFLGVPVYLAQIITLNIASTIIFSYAVFFLTRVFMIQLLAVLAPIAILAGALPQTKRIFDLWKDWLIGWSFGGILVLFLLTLGLTCIDAIGKLPSDPSVSLGAGEWTLNLIMKWQFKWIALSIYMMAVEAFCLVAIPSLAKEFTEKIKSGGKAVGSLTSGGGKKVQERVFDKTTSGMGLGTAAERKAGIKAEKAAAAANN